MTFNDLQWPQWPPMTTNDLQWPQMTYFWLFLAISGYFWLFKAISDYFWPFLAILGYFWLFWAIYSYFWLFLAIAGYLWLFMAIYGYLWLFLAISGSFTYSPSGSQAQAQAWCSRVICQSSFTSDCTLSCSELGNQLLPNLTGTLPGTVCQLH